MTRIETRRLGKSGLEVSAIGLGCNNFGRVGTQTETQEGTTAMLAEAVDLGVTMLDTADIYGATPGQSETMMGVALRGRRDRVVLATKFGHAEVDMGIGGGAAKGSRAYIREAIAHSLRRLETDHIDLYQMHTPDPSVPIGETIAALNELVDEGKIRFFGHSQFSAEQMVDAARAARSLGLRDFISAQDEYSLLARGVEAAVLPTVAEMGLAFLPFFPLHNGLLTGKFTRSVRPADSRITRQRPHIADDAPWDTLEKYEAYCAERSISMLVASIGWLLSHSAVTSVIAGATRPSQLRQNVEAASQWLPTKADLKVLDDIFS